MSVGRRVVQAGLATIGLVGVLCGRTEAPLKTTSPATPANPQVIPPEMRLGPLPRRAPDPIDNPTTPAKLALGRLLFFDPALSSTKDVSCATCHHPRFGWSDGRETPIGVGGIGLGPARTLRAPTTVPLLDRNTPSLLNVGWNGLVSGVPVDPSSAPMFWDSRVRGLEQQVSHPIQSPAEMCGDGCLEGAAATRAVERLQAITAYRTLFAEAFDSATGPAVSPLHLTQAIAAFERSLTTPGTSFDRYVAGETSALTPLAQRGLNVFQDAGCIQCHGGPMFSDFKLHFLGVPDGTPAGRRSFRTPTLRNLRHTAPYLHNGSRRTVRDVLIFYDELAEGVSETLDGGDSSAYPPLDPLLKHLNLNAEDFPALEAFLDALNAEDYDQTVPGAVPSGLPVAR